ncbi:hypothetical protein Vadar_007402 [Vaccinium darrowii]|uniref:Uncharacterized protein n=1 Tax=Vaccinium darrowii TaxID=229202 RepID=A0ACB7Y6S3_9ERIC|nr:hypothetical protein Vadar_007402 [Vaccinium darrowii]
MRTSSPLLQCRAADFVLGTQFRHCRNGASLLKRGMVTGNQYNGKDKVLGRRSGKPEDRGGKCGISIMLRGCSGFSSYGIFEHQEGCPDVNIYQGSIVFKLEERL